MFPTTKNRTPSPECEQWAKACLTTDHVEIKPLPEHAHHNKFYFTMTIPGDQKQYLLVETHNDMASSLKFSTTAKILRKNNIHTPNIYHQKISQQKSWMIMTHFGNMSMLDWLQQNQNKKQKDILMRHCLDEIGKFQKQTLDYPTRTYNAKTLRSDIERSDTYYLQQLFRHRSKHNPKSKLCLRENIFGRSNRKKYPSHRCILISIAQTSCYCRKEHWVYLIFKICKLALSITIWPLY